MHCSNCEMPLVPPIFQCPEGTEYRSINFNFFFSFADPCVFLQHMCFAARAALASFSAMCVAWNCRAPSPIPCTILRLKRCPAILLFLLISLSLSRLFVNKVIIIVSFLLSEFGYHFLTLPLRSCPSSQSDACTSAAPYCHTARALRTTSSAPIDPTPALRTGVLQTGG